jgi:Tfp pilus assembly protein PilV
MNYNIDELISIVLLIMFILMGLASFVVMIFNKEAEKRWDEIARQKRQWKLRNKLAKTDPFYSLKKLENAVWAQRNNQPTVVLAKMNQADYEWKKQHNPNNPQLELFN